MQVNEARGRGTDTERRDEKQKSLLTLEVVSVAALIKQLSPEEDTTPPLALTLLSSLSIFFF